MVNTVDRPHIALDPLFVKGKERRRFEGKHGECRHERIGEGQVLLAVAIIRDVGEAASNQAKERLRGQILASFRGNDRPNNPPLENLTSVQ